MANEKDSKKGLFAKAANIFRKKDNNGSSDNEPIVKTRTRGNLTKTKTTTMLPGGGKSVKREKSYLNPESGSSFKFTRTKTKSADGSKVKTSTYDSDDKYGIFSQERRKTKVPGALKMKSYNEKFVSPEDYGNTQSVSTSTRQRFKVKDKTQNASNLKYKSTKMTDKEEFEPYTSVSGKKVPGHSTSYIYSTKKQLSASTGKKKKSMYEEQSDQYDNMTGKKIKGYKNRDGKTNERKLAKFFGIKVGRKNK